MKKYRLYLYCGIIMLTSELWKQWCLTYILNDGCYDWWYFPFQLCSLPMYICLLLPFIPSGTFRQMLLTFLMDFSLLGGVCAFLDTSGMHYDYLPLTIHSFAWHILLIIIGIYTGLSQDADYSPRGYILATGFYGCCCLIATCFNLTFYRYGSLNMFYINPRYDMTQKVFSNIAKALGTPAGIMAYILATIIGAGILHLLWFCTQNKKL